MPPVQFFLIAAAAGALFLCGNKVVKGVKIVDRKVCHVATLGHKCKTKQASVQPKQGN
jgi:hypothetical protein